VTREDRIRNEYVKGSIGVASIADNMRENRFRWFSRFKRFRSSKNGYGNEYRRKKRKRKIKEEVIKRNCVL